MKIIACISAALLIMSIAGCQKEVKEIRGHGDGPTLAQAQVDPLVELID